MRRIWLSGMLILVAAVLSARAVAQPPVPCGRFTENALPLLEPRTGGLAVRRFEHIREAARAHSYRVIFLGDSLTQRWDEVPENRPVWDRYFRPLDALNAGINGDRTDHLMWRLEHGNLDNQHPRAAVLLIGTNDLGYGHAPEEAAEGVRRILLRLREALPRTRILLEGLWPRSDRAQFAAGIEPVNRMIRQCADNEYVFYADPGRRLADAEGRLRRDLAPDGLHPNTEGYEIVSATIAKALEPLLGSR